MKRNRAPKILVVGAGGIGGTVAGCLAEVECDVIASTTNRAIFEAVDKYGYRLQGDGGTRSVPGRISHGLPKEETFDYILLATQPPQVEQAAREAKHLLAEDGRMVVFQNGLCEERIAKICGDDAVVGAIISWGASMIQPGVYDRTSPGGFQIGTMSGLRDEALRFLGGLLEAIGPVTISKNLLGARWSKLAINSCISTLGTIGGERLGPLVRVRRYRRLGLEVFAEAVQVAKAEGVSLEKVSGTIDLAWMAISEKERRLPASPNLAAKHAMLLAVGMRYRRLRSSMLQAIERGRPPSVDFLNGEIVKRGAAHSILTPVNARMLEAVHSIAKGQERSGRALLDQIYDETR